MAAFRITNVTNIATGSRGHFLDLGKDNGGKHISVGGQIVMEAKTYDLLPACIQTWASKNWVRVVNLDVEGGHVVAGLPPQDGDLTPSMINPISEMQGKDVMDNEEPDLEDAHEAKLPGMEGTGPINQSTVQSSNARVSQAMQEERLASDISPIPGDSPKNVDDSAPFTVRAGRSKQPGAVIGKGK